MFFLIILFFFGGVEGGAFYVCTYVPTVGLVPHGPVTDWVLFDVYVPVHNVDRDFTPCFNVVWDGRKTWVVSQNRSRVTKSDLCSQGRRSSRNTCRAVVDGWIVVNARQAVVARLPIVVFIVVRVLSCGGNGGGGVVDREQCTVQPRECVSSCSLHHLACS